MLNFIFQSLFELLELHYMSLVLEERYNFLKIDIFTHLLDEFLQAQADEAVEVCPLLVCRRLVIVLILIFFLFELVYLRFDLEHAL